MSRAFLGRNTVKLSKLGKGRRKLWRWRAAVGRHSKIRKNRFGYTKSPRIGFGRVKTAYATVKGKSPLLITTAKDFKQATTNTILIISRRVGAKKKIEFIKRARELKLPLLNVTSGDTHGPK